MRLTLTTKIREAVASPAGSHAVAPRNHRRTDRATSHRLVWWLAAAGVTILIAVGAIASVGNSSTGVTDPERWDLAALDSDEHVRLADFRGKPVVVNFFASWCTSCEFELPHFAAAARALRGQVVFVGVNAMETGDGMGMAREFRLRESGFVLAKDTGGRQGSGLHDALGGRGMPITAFYDADGALVDGVGGALSEDVLLDKLNQLYGVEV